MKNSKFVKFFIIFTLFSMQLTFADTGKSGEEQEVLNQEYKKALYLIDQNSKNYTKREYLDKYNEEQKALYQDLEKNAFEFFDLRANSEQNLSHSMASYDIADWKLEQRKWFAQIIKDLEMDKLKITKSDDYKQVDSTLNKEYQKALHLIDQVGKDCIKREYYAFTFDNKKIKKSQRAWLKYRDSLAKFGVSRYPKISEEDWKAWLSKIRIAQLQEMEKDVELYKE